MKKAFAIASMVFVFENMQGMSMINFRRHSLPTPVVSKKSLICRNISGIHMIKTRLAPYTSPYTPPKNSNKSSSNSISSDDSEELIQFYVGENQRLLRNIQLLRRECTDLNGKCKKISKSLDKELLQKLIKLTKKLNSEHDNPVTNKSQKIVVPLEKKDLLPFYVGENKRLSQRVSDLKREIQTRKDVLQMLELCYSTSRSTNAMQNYLNLQVKSDADQEELNFDKIFSEYISLEPSIESEVISQKQKDS